MALGHTLLCSNNMFGVKYWPMEIVEYNDHNWIIFFGVLFWKYFGEGLKLEFLV